MTRLSRPWWRRLWLPLSLVFLVLVVYFRAPLKRKLRRLERRLFAHIGDQGPLQQVKQRRWKQVLPGVWSKTLLLKRRRAWLRFQLKVLRFDPKKIRFSLHVGTPVRIRKVMQNPKWIAAINAGLFDKKRRPLGVFVHKSRVRNRYLHRRRIDGVFFMKKDRPGMARGRGFRTRGIRLAFQSAPLLVVAGKRLALPRKRWSWQIDRRSALCLDRRGHLLWMTTDTFLNGLSYTELGLLMKQQEKAGGLGCVWGLNLDGGASTQMALRVQGRVRRVVGLEKIPVYLVASQKAEPDMLKQGKRRR